MAEIAKLVEVLQQQLMLQREEAKADRNLLLQQLEVQREQMQLMIAGAQREGNGRSKGALCERGCC